MAADGKESISSGAFPLHEAVISGNFDAVQKHTNRESINQPDNLGNTPLHYAALYGRYEIAQHLVNKRANCFFTNGEGLIPLECAASAARGKKLDTLLYLLFNDDVDIRRAEGKTLLHHAARGGDKRCIEFLIRQGADVNTAADFGQTPLQHAVEAKNPEAMVILTEHGAKLELKARDDVHVADKDGRTALHFAAMDRPFKVVAALLEAGADVDTKDREGKTPLDYAIQNKNLQAIAAFKKAGVKLEEKDASIFNYKDQYGKTVQHYIDENTPISQRAREIFRRFKPLTEVVMPHDLPNQQSPDQKPSLDGFLGCIHGLDIELLPRQDLEKLIGRLKTSKKSKERDQDLLELCHQALWLEHKFAKEAYSFFDVAIEHLEKESRDKLKTEDEYRYFQKLKRIKLSEKDLYETMQAFDAVIQQAGFTAEEKIKSYRAANMQMHRALHSSAVLPVSTSFEQIYTELSSKGKTSKETSGLLGCVAGALSVVVGVGFVLFGIAGIVASVTSVGATWGVSSPIALAGIWESGALIVSGIGLITGGAVIAKDSLKRYQEGCREQKDRGEQWKNVSDTLIKNVNEVVQSRENASVEKMDGALRQSETSELGQFSEWVIALKEGVMSLSYAEEKNNYLDGVLENLGNLSGPLETFCENIGKPEIVYSEELDEGLLKLCHQALWIEYHFEDPPYNFFYIAVSLLQCHGNPNLKKTAEYQYLHNVNQLSLVIHNESNELLFDKKDLLDIAFDVEWAIQNSNLDKTELYKRANVQVKKILKFSSHVEKKALNECVKDLKAISEELRIQQVSDANSGSMPENAAELLSSPMGLVGNWGDALIENGGECSDSSKGASPKLT